MKIITFMLCAFVTFALTSARAETPPETATYIDLTKYAGHWYEIAAFPQWFERSCVGSTADYTLRSDGNVDVVNKCFDDDFNGRVKTVKGIAKVTDKKSNSKLKVSFFRPFYAQYWIVDIDADYRFAVVSNSKKSTLWILSRTPQLEKSVYDTIVTRLRDRGFDVDRLKLTPQQ